MVTTPFDVRVLFLNRTHLNKQHVDLPLEKIRLGNIHPNFHPHVYHSEVVIIKGDMVSRIFKCPEGVQASMATKDVWEYVKLLPPPVYTVLL